MGLYLYDPRINVSTKTSYKYLEKLTGLTISGLSRAKTRGSKIKQINCYLSDGFPDIQKRREWYSKEKYTDEAWIPIEGSENKFMVSNYGRIKRIYKYKEGFILPYQRKGRGNLFVKVQCNGKYGEYKIGQLVAHHFIREPRPGESVIRKNGIITDDYVANLAYVTKEELGKKTGYKSKSKPVIQIDAKTGEVVQEYRSAREAGRKLFLSYQAVLDNCHGKTKVAGGMYKFRFLEDYEVEIA